MRRTLAAVMTIGFVAAAAPASLASQSSVKLWTALGGDLVCGIAIHPPGTQPTRVLCSGPGIPVARHGYGDGHFVFLGSHGRPTLARLSQDSFAGSRQVALRAGTRWAPARPSVFCQVKATNVRCENRDSHGFTVTKHSYKAF